MQSIYAKYICTCIYTCFNSTNFFLPTVCKRHEMFSLSRKKLTPAQLRSLIPRAPSHGQEGLDQFKHYINPGQQQQQQEQHAEQLEHLNGRLRNIILQSKFIHEDDPLIATIKYIKNILRYKDPVIIEAFDAFLLSLQVRFGKGKFKEAFENKS